MGRTARHDQIPELAPDSIAAVVLRPYRRPARARSPSPELAAGSIAHEILGRRAPRRGGSGIAALLVAAAAHGLGATVLTVSLGAEPQSASLSAPARGELTVELDAALPPVLQPPPPPPEPEPAESPPEPEPAERPPEPASDPVPPARRSSPSRSPAKPRKARSPTASPAPPAQAGQVVAAEGPGDALPVFDMVSGDGPTYAGGVTSSTGTGTSPGGSGSSPAPSSSGSEARPRSRSVDRSSPVRLPARRWMCDWPREADDLGIDEQTVVLRVVVRASGEVASVDVTVDPGHGFGAAAKRCALSTRFEPARDREGRAHAATSAPIRVRFSR